MARCSASQSSAKAGSTSLGAPRKSPTNFGVAPVGRQLPSASAATATAAIRAIRWRRRTSRIRRHHRRSWSVPEIPFMGRAADRRRSGSGTAGRRARAPWYMKGHMNGRDAEETEDAGYGETSRYAAHLDRGWALLDRGDLAAARTSVQHAQDVRPDDPDAAVLLGAIALAEGNAQDSLRCYDRAIEMDGEYLEPYAAAAAVCLYELDDPARALRYVSDALELEDLAPFELF